MFSIHLLLRLYINIYTAYLEIGRQSKQNTDAMFKVMVKRHLTFVFCVYETIKAKIITD